MMKKVLGISVGLILILSLIPIMVFGADVTYVVNGTDNSSVLPRQFSNIDTAVNSCTYGSYEIKLTKASDTLSRSTNGKNITINIASGCTLTISSGTYSNLKITGSGSVKINNGEVSGINVGGNVKVNVSGTGKLNGSTFSGDSSLQISSGEVSGINVSGDVQVNVTGGKLSDSTFSDNSKLQISGGVFNDITVNGSVDLDINGGSFTNLNIGNSVKFHVKESDFPGSFTNSTVFSIETSPGVFSYYNTLLGALYDVPKNKYSTNVKMYGDWTKDIEIAGNQNVTLDLNGYTLGNETTNPAQITYIENYGNLIITDEKNTEDVNDSDSSITVGNGKVHSTICNSGSLTIKAGKYTQNAKLVYYDKKAATDKTGGKDLLNYLYKSANEVLEQSSYYYEDSGKTCYYVLKSGNLDYYLSCEVYDSKGNLVKSTDSDTIQDVSLGEKYITKIYIKSNNANNVTLNGFKIIAAYKFVDGDNYKYNRMTIETPYVDENKYYSVKSESIEDEEIGLLTYDLPEANDYKIPAGLNENLTPKENYKGIQIAQYNFVVDNSVATSSTIEFGFAGFGDFKDIAVNYGGAHPQTVNVMTPGTSGTVGYELLSNVCIKDCQGTKVNTKNLKDGVNVADYKYAPDGYKLAIITMEHKDGEFLKYGDTPMYYTSNSNYISESTNPRGLKAAYLNSTSEELKAAVESGNNPELGRVYLKLVKIEELVDEGLLEEADIDNYSKISEAILKKITIKKVEGYKTYLEDNAGTVDNCIKKVIEGGAEPQYIFKDSDNYLYSKYDDYMKSFNLEYKSSDSENSLFEYIVDNKTVKKAVNPYDVDRDGIVDYNDASMIYRILQSNGDIWSYDINIVGNYLGERGRLFAAADGDAIFYGTILDVVNIISNYTKLD